MLVRALKSQKSLRVEQLLAEAYPKLSALETDQLAQRDINVLNTGKPPFEWEGKVRPLHKKGDNLQPWNARPICCAVTEPMLVCWVIFGRIQTKLYKVGHVPDSMSVSLGDRCALKASLLYHQYLDDEELEELIASLQVKSVFPCTPYSLMEEVWRQLGLLYGDFVAEYQHTRRYTIAMGKGCTE